jgi:mannan endo-1,4-beta-mannosidase
MGLVTWVRADHEIEEVNAAPQSTSLDERPRDFVRVSGTRFVIGETPFHFIGANAGVVHGRPHREAMERTLDAVQADGLRVIRIWALGERAEDAPEWSRDFAFRLGESGWIESSFEHLDRLLVAARERDLRAIVVLANRWRDYGGIPQYLRWIGVPFDEQRQSGPSEFEIAHFWDSPQAEALYRAHVRRVVSRVNSVSGVAYRDDPTIMAWELVNESGAPPRASASLVRWTQAQARFIRELDPHHLISAGHIGYDRAHERDTWLAIQRLPEIDYCDAHAYPAAYGRVRDPRELARYVDDRVQLAHHVARKPFVWGEFGFSTRAPRVLGMARARLYHHFLRAAHRDGVAGALVWTYLPYEDRPLDHGIHPAGEGERRTRDVRAVLARAARRWARNPPEERNPRLGQARGADPIFERIRHARGTSRVHRDWSDDGRLIIPIDAFERARFEAFGRFDGGALEHVYGVGRGDVRYRFASPPRAMTRLTLTMRASSELPGNGHGATAEDGSRVRVWIDEEIAGEVDLPVDDGLGRRVVLAIEDGELLGRIFAPPRRTHTLRLEVVPGHGAEGLCLYGEATGREAIDPEIAAELPGAIELAITL